MFHFYPRFYAPVYYMPVPYFVRADYLSLPRQEVQAEEPYLLTWPYSNVYYGNYFES
ncbi:hypothetical protein [Ectobacillus panaciterrae]|uniref:hypothetical protein n=1 Tax=Ectobacillus panaciterrae TaxID=363872 RepID=UPI000416342B|nr:hypothetical protein [Ectobacillus panaciterrae]